MYVSLITQKFVQYHLDWFAEVPPRGLTICSVSPPLCATTILFLMEDLPQMLQLWLLHTKMETWCFFPSYANRTKCSWSHKGALLSLL